MHKCAFHASVIKSCLQTPLCKFLRPVLSRIIKRVAIKHTFKVLPIRDSDLDYSNSSINYAINPILVDSSKTEKSSNIQNFTVLYNIYFRALTGYFAATAWTSFKNNSKRHKSRTFISNHTLNQMLLKHLKKPIKLLLEFQLPDSHFYLQSLILILYAFQHN